MENHNDVVHQMEKIRYIFQHALYISTEQETIDVQAYTHGIDPEFRSVAYEGIAMGLAMKDFSAGSLQRWRSLAKTAEAIYLPHIHVGLGWAISKQKLPSLVFLDTLDPLMLFRVVDGCGYYDGMFRQISTLTNKLRPAYIENKDFQAYDQGVGRSLWYSSKGEASKLADLIHPFDDARKADLWRGIGIACSYVGSCNEHTLRSLLSLSGEHQRQLAIGAAFTARARIQTNSLTEEAERACRIWCNRSAQQVMALVIETEPSFGVSKDEAYKMWLSQIETELQLS